MRTRLLLAPIVLVALVLTACSGSSGGSSSSDGSQKKNSEVTVALAASSDEVKKLEKELDELRSTYLELLNYNSGLEDLYSSAEQCQLAYWNVILDVMDAEGLWTDSAFAYWASAESLCGMYRDEFDDFYRDFDNYSNLAQRIVSIRLIYAER